MLSIKSGPAAQQAHPCSTHTRARARARTHDFAPAPARGTRRQAHARLQCVCAVVFVDQDVAQLCANIYRESPSEIAFGLPLGIARYRPRLPTPHSLSSASTGQCLGEHPSRRSHRNKSGNSLRSYQHGHSLRPYQHEILVLKVPFIKTRVEI